MATVTRPAALVQQGSLKLYTTAIKVADLRRPNFCTIKKLDPEQGGSGYQRLLNEARARKLAEYLLDGRAEGEAFLPTSIFLATEKDIAFDLATNTITFDTDVVGPFSVVDGQHRIAGLIMAAEKDDQLLDFEVPVNIAVGLDDISQMCHFLIVNTTQRSVDKAVEQQIVARLTGMVQLEDVPLLPRWIRRQVEKGEDARALIIATHLNSEPTSPWYGKIKMANDVRDANTTISQESFVSSVKKYVFAASNPLSVPDWDTRRHLVLCNYWKAVEELLVDPDATKSSVVYKTTGVDLFHLVSATVFNHLFSQKDFKKDSMKAVLQRGFDNLTAENVGMSHPEWWQRGNTASGLNSSAVRKLATELNHAINAREGIGDIAL